MSFYIPPRDELSWVGIDLDNTLAEPIWPELGIGDPIWDNVDKMVKVYDAGYKIVIHTSRYHGDYELIEEWLKHYDLKRMVKEIQCGKQLYAAYVDDKSIPADASSWIPSNNG